MRKILPYIPITIFAVGMLVVNIGNHPVGIMSNSLNPTEIKEVWGCEKPKKYAEKGAILLCKNSLPVEQEKHKDTWSWSCVRGDEIKKCSFRETTKLPTRGGVFFDNK